MKLRDLVVRYCLIDLRCGDCHTHTALDPTFFLARRGDIELGDLAHDMVCPACGSREISLHAVTPVQATVGLEDVASSRSLQRSSAEA